MSIYDDAKKAGSEIATLRQRVDTRGGQLQTIIAEMPRRIALLEPIVAQATTAKGFSPELAAQVRREVEGFREQLASARTELTALTQLDKAAAATYDDLVEVNAQKTRLDKVKPRPADYAKKLEAVEKLATWAVAQAKPLITKLKAVKLD